MSPLSNPTNATIADGQGEGTIQETAAGVTITPLSDPVTTESGGMARFSVVLDSQPTGTVTLLLSTSDPTEGLLASAAAPSSLDDDLYLDFDPVDWYQPKDIFVVGVDDSDHDANVSYQIIITVIESRDPFYYDYNPYDIQLTNIDDETDPGTTNYRQRSSLLLTAASIKLLSTPMSASSWTVITGVSMAATPIHVGPRPSAMDRASGSLTGMTPSMSTTAMAGCNHRGPLAA